MRGEQDPTWGQAVTAYVAAEPEAPADLDQQIQAALRRRLAAYKIPKRVTLVSRLDDVA